MQVFGRDDVDLSSAASIEGRVVLKPRGSTALYACHTPHRGLPGVLLLRTWRSYDVVSFLDVRVSPLRRQLC